MKAITLWQPWASLKVTEHKNCETKSRPAPASWKSGELVAIHAAIKPAYEALDAMGVDPAEGLHLKMMDALGVDGATLLTGLPLGAVLGICRYNRCWPAENTSFPMDDLWEQDFGDFSEGRWAWNMPMVLKLEKPIRARGKQGAWDWDAPQWMLDEIAEGGQE